MRQPDNLQRRDTIAFGDRPNALMTLVVRKTPWPRPMAKIIDRLKARERPTLRSVTDIDTIDEMAEELGDDSNFHRLLPSIPRTRR